VNLVGCRAFPRSFELGRTLTVAGRVPAALEADEQALKFSPDFAEAQQAPDAVRKQKP